MSCLCCAQTCKETAADLVKTSEMKAALDAKDETIKLLQDQLSAAKLKCSTLESALETKVEEYVNKS